MSAYDCCDCGAMKQELREKISEKNESLAEARDREAALLARVERLRKALETINVDYMDGCSCWEVSEKALSEDKQ